jgi:hypothetical protein
MPKAGEGNVGRRSTTDPVTNTTVLSGFDTERYLAWLYNRKVEVNDILPTFLHEVTHHWCFDSIVGATIALLHMRARQTAFLTGCKSSNNWLKVLEDLIRVDAAVELLQPLAEGLAQFAEYDAQPGKSNYISTPLLSALFCFGPPILPTEKQRTLPLEVLLQLVRRSTTFCERKAGALARPLSGSDGYLAGYLAVKALWAHAYKQCPLFEDRDLFLGYLRSWIYDDADFISVLLSEKTSEVESATAVSRHLHKRINKFLEYDFGKNLPNWIEHTVSGERTGVVPGIDVSAESYAVANEKLEPLFYEHELRKFDTEGEEAVVAFKYFVTMNRKLMLLGEVDAALEINENGQRVIRLKNGGEFEMEDAHRLASGSYPGRLFVVWESASLTVGILFLLNADCLPLKTLGNASPETMKEFQRYVINYHQFGMLGRTLESKLEEVTADSKFKIARDHIDIEAHRIAEETFGEITTLHVPDEKRSSVLCQLRESGILSLLGDDPTLTRGLAAIGIANTMTYQRSGVELLLSVMGFEAKSVEKGLLEKQDRCGMRLLASSQDMLVAFV